LLPLGPNEARECCPYSSYRTQGKTGGERRVRLLKKLALGLLSANFRSLRITVFRSLLTL
jgi:hypothetical protein